MQLPDHVKALSGRRRQLTSRVKQFARLILLNWRANWTKVRSGVCSTPSKTIIAERREGRVRQYVVEI